MVAVESLHPMISALVLEAQLENSLSDKRVMMKVASRVFDAQMEVPPQ